MAFGGGLMITKVAGEFLGSGTITIMNTAGSTVDLTGVRLMKNSVEDTQCASLSGTLAAGATTTASCSSLNPDGMVYLADMDGDNDGSNEGSTDTKFWVIDGVCWNNGAGSVGSCDGSGDAIIAAGLWAEDAYVNDANDEGIQLVANGNNEDGVGDWEAIIPEFGTILMPIASVLLIVGYNYRRKETEA